jgi:ADP-ribose pyrophosphatase YjhB (NUDIX family)
MKRGRAAARGESGASGERLETGYRAMLPSDNQLDIPGCIRTRPFLLGIGLAGDRYAIAAGFWRDAKVIRDLTLIESEAIEELERRTGVVLAPGEARRNLTTRGVELNRLVGETFWVGGALCRGTHLCEPCRHLEEVTGKVLLRPLVRRGGLRARLLNSAVIRVGDRVTGVAEQEGVGVVVSRRGKVLMGRRLSAHGFGTWSFPGGKPRPSESPRMCALRELREETGIEAADPRPVGVTVDGFRESGDVFRTTFVRVDAGADAPVACEPAKTAAWEWFDWRWLPQPLFAPVASLVEAGYEPAVATS